MLGFPKRSRNKLLNHYSENQTHVFLQNLYFSIEFFFFLSLSFMVQLHRVWDSLLHRNLCSWVWIRTWALDTVDILDWVLVCVIRVWDKSSNPNPYPLDAGGDKQQCTRHCPVSPCEWRVWALSQVRATIFLGRILFLVAKFYIIGISLEEIKISILFT